MNDSPPKPPPSARPPRAREPNVDRFAVLADADAQSFISQAPDIVAAGGMKDAPAPAPAPAQSRAARPRGRAGQAPEPPPPDPWKSYPLRLRTSMHADLQYIAENSPRSMNQFITEVLEPAIKAELEHIAKIKKVTR